MLNAKIIQIPDYTEFIEKEFILISDFNLVNYLNIPMLKGVRFVINKIINSEATIKISNSKEELEDMGILDFFFNRSAMSIKKDIETLKEVLKMWEDEPDKFIEDKESFWNTDRGNGKGAPINTGYYGINSKDSDSIITLDYKRIDEVKNIYSYQANRNTFYSKECYYFMIKGREVELEKNKKKIGKESLFDYIFEEQEIKIQTLNTMNFKVYG